MAIYESTVGMNLFFDLDGTLVDSKERLYKLFQYLVPVSDLSFDDYWKLKRNKTAHREILSNRFFFSVEAIGMFEKEWMQLIEEPQWIALDRPFEGVTGYLKKMKKDHTLYLLTARQFEDVLTRQLNQYEWTGLFQKVFITKQQQEKYDLLYNAGIVADNDWLIGDTGKDIETGKKLKIHTAAVTSGFQSEEILKAYAPDVITETVLNLSFEPLKS